MFRQYRLGIFERNEDEGEESLHADESDVNTETVSECYN